MSTEAVQSFIDENSPALQNERKKNLNKSCIDMMHTMIEINHINKDIVNIIAKVYIESDKWVPIGHFLTQWYFFFEIFAKKETNLQKWIQIHTNVILRTCNYNFNKTSYSKLIEIIHLFRGILLWVKKYYCESFDE